MDNVSAIIIRTETPINGRIYPKKAILKALVKYADKSPVGYAYLDTELHEAFNVEGIYEDGNDIIVAFSTMDTEAGNVLKQTINNKEHQLAFDGVGVVENNTVKSFKMDSLCIVDIDEPF